MNALYAGALGRRRIPPAPHARPGASRSCDADRNRVHRISLGTLISNAQGGARYEMRANLTSLISASRAAESPEISVCCRRRPDARSWPRASRLVDFRRGQAGAVRQSEHLPVALLRCEQLRTVPALAERRRGQRVQDFAMTPRRRRAASVVLWSASSDEALRRIAAPGWPPAAGSPRCWPVRSRPQGTRLRHSRARRNEKLYRVLSFSRRCPWINTFRKWNTGELSAGGRARLWRAACPCGRDARASTEAILRQAATQALPILRSASSEDADHSTNRRRAASPRRHPRSPGTPLTTPTFGKRGNSPKLLTSEERYRQMLGLPHGPRLSAPEIHQAWKRAAKSAHPDGGGSTQRFQELSAARRCADQGSEIGAHS